MPNMTLAVPEDLHALIKRHPEVSWSEVARRAMLDYARKLDLLDQITAASSLTEQDIEEVGKQVKAAIRKRHGAKP